jgi:phage gp46-like protein
MTDLALFWDNQTGHADLRVAGADLVVSDDLETAILISLFTDRRAPADVELPAGEDRRGWWGDSYPDREGDELGSLLWLLDREKETQEVLERTRIYAREALRWLIEDGVATEVDVQASIPAPGTRLLQVTITQPNGQQSTLRFPYTPGAAPNPFDELPGVPGEIQGTPGTAPLVASSWAAPSAGPAGEVQGTPGTAPVVATSWAPGAVGSSAEIQGESGVPAVAADAWEPETPSKPGEIRGTAGTPPLVANSWGPEPSGKPGEVSGTSGMPPVEADTWAPAEAGKPGEVQGAAGDTAIDADPWAPPPTGLGGEVGCGGALGLPPPTFDSTLITFDSTLYTWDQTHDD